MRYLIAAMALALIAGCGPRVNQLAAYGAASKEQALTSLQLLPRACAGDEIACTALGNSLQAQLIAAQAMTGSAK